MMNQDFSFVDEICRAYIDKGYFPSVVVGIFDKEGTLYRTALGDNPTHTSVRQPVNPDTIYDVASMTKIATSTQILLLMDAGQLTLETTVPEVLTEIKARPTLYERLKDVTMYQLLTHTSGIIDWYPFYVQAGQDFYDVFESFIGSTEIEPGMVYSDMNFMLLGKVIEKIQGKPLQQCQEEFKQLLEASHMDFLPKDFTNMAPSSYGNGIEEEMCAERGLTFDGWRSKTEITLGAVNDGNAHYFFDGVAGHAGIFANVDAYERLGRLYLNSSSPLFQQSMKEQTDGRGLGWQTGDMYPAGCGHTGFTGTCIWVCPEKGIGAIAFTNRLCYPDRYGTNTNEFRRELNQAIYQAL
jgi:CubicO group peptidase (beta-lactamase class C family)